ncbi:Transposase family tnp2 [Rhizoctonia solani]|uniref:Transposase family tnp2 n=1 Tax=Rhizoctonia solani TaxID=456999 RepID=A0A8H7LL03_9AGAM|nr:Transposase family tnp2 [Rhizoctonia solani]
MGSDKELSTNDLDPSGSQVSGIVEIAQNLDAEDQEETHTLDNAIGFHTYKSDGEQSERSDYSRGSWYHIPTPPPSPPSSPPPDQDVPEPLEDEDGFQNLNAIDFCEYDQWYAEPDTGEDVEMHAETLTDKEVDSIIMLAIRQFGTLLTSHRLQTQIAKLSGVNPVNVDCCINVCHAFTGKYAKETICSVCNAPRYNFKNCPRQVFQYLPASPRFRAYFNNPDLIRKMLYRHEFKHWLGRIDDFFNSQIYERLLRTNIVIDGADTGVQHFPGKHDIAIAVMSDGVNIFNQGSKETNTCWPIMAQNLNLPPEERAQMRNLIPLGVIPGPNKPKDFDSFLVPFVEECIDLAKGIDTYNAMTGQTFTLRVHPVIISGDMQAIKYLQNFKGPNGRVPCCGCLMVGVYHADKKTYYIPLAEPIATDSSSANVNSYDPHNLPLCTDKKTSIQTRKIDKALTAGLAEDLRKRTGICGPSILDHIPSIQRPSLYPHEFMHLFLLNHGPALVSLWVGTHPGISNAGSGYYLLLRAVWTTIGIETEEATYLLPASILKCLLNLKNTTQRIEELKQEIIEYVEKFEEYYYQYDYDRLSVCRLTLHALLHVADNVLRCGPVWVAWSFSVEQYCWEIVGCARSKVVPYPTINRHILQMAQLALVACRFPIIRKAMLFGKSQAPVRSSKMEMIYHGYPNTILRYPHLPGFPLNPHVRRRLAQYFHTNYQEWTFHAWLAFIPDRAERWGKLRIPEGDSVCCAAVVDPLLSDLNENFRNRPCNMVDAFGYGRLDFIIALTLPRSKKFKIDEPTLHILAHITEAKGAEGDAATDFVSFTQFGRSIILDVTSVQRVVGRIYTKGVKELGEWYIIDRTLNCCETVFHPAEHPYDDD